MRDPVRLHQELERIYALCHRPELLGIEAARSGGAAEEGRGDPLAFARLFDDAADREACALLASALAFGRVESIFATLRECLRRIEDAGEMPGSLLADFNPTRHRGVFDSVVHRWVRGTDLELFLWRMTRVIARHGGLENAFCAHAGESAKTVFDGLSGLAREIRELTPEPYRESRGADYLFVAPEGGSACKRGNLFLRWVVRPDDGLDLGLWPRVDPARLILPLDTHVARISRRLGLTVRRSVDWRAAEEVTDSLRLFDRGDPTRFDFAICRLGILGRCPRRPDPALCGECGLREHCVAGALVSGRRR